MLFTAVLAATMLPVAAQDAHAVSVQAQVRQQVQSFLRSRAPQGTTSIDVKVPRSFDSGKRLSGKLDIRVRTRHPGPFIGRVPVTVMIYSGDQEVKRGVLTAEVRVEGPVFIASQRLERGHVISAEDIVQETRDLSSLRGKTAKNASALVGRQVVRSLRAGTVLRSDHVKSVSIVKRGQHITLRMKRGRLRIDTKGIAREDGSAGQMIRVLNQRSKREISGWLDEEGIVHVPF